MLGAASLVMDWELPGLGAALALLIAGLVVTRRAALAPGRFAVIAGVAIFAALAPVVILVMSLDFTNVW
jgi:hypothetical protein